jgi:hypothetical protein
MEIQINIMMIRKNLINSLFNRIIQFNKTIFLEISFKRLRFNIKIRFPSSNLTNRIIISHLILSIIIKNKIVCIKI